MVWSRHHPHADLRATLEALPPEWVVAPLGPAFVVLGPTGAHVVALDDGREDAAADLARAARTVRGCLAEHVALMPFVHALLVTDRPGSSRDATRIPAELLSLALIDGPPTLTTDELDRLRECVAAQALAGADQALAPGRMAL